MSDSDNGGRVASHENLLVWQKSINLVEKIYIATSKYPSDEKFGLISQMRRSAVSIPSNIAEGKSRNTTKDFIQFLHIALGSLAELDTQIVIAEKLKFSSNKECVNLRQQTLELKLMLSKLIAVLKTKAHT
ncbi:MAG: four helix bundle protein [Patescibacteria group bacterium]